MNELGNSGNVRSGGRERPPQVLYYIPSECGLLRLPPWHQSLVLEVTRHQHERARQESSGSDGNH